VQRDRRHWAVIGLEPGLPYWTPIEMTVSFLGLELLLRPETEYLLPSVAVAFEPPVTWEDALTLTTPQEGLPHQRRLINPVSLG
jgi:hypothetical protein